jgi:hypothetical protein
MDQPLTDPRTLSETSTIFRRHFDGGVWHWTYHDEQGRLLVRGPEHDNRWLAHRGLLEAIADHYASGEGGDEEEDESAVEGDAFHHGAVTVTTPSTAAATGPEPIELPLPQCARRSA